MTSVSKFRRFKPPTITAEAIGTSPLTPSPLLQVSADDFAPYPAPTHRDDHAAQFALDVQTFDQFRRYFFTPVARRAIVLVPLGALEIDTSILLAFVRAFFPTVAFDLHEPVDVDALGIRHRVAHRFCVDKYVETHRQYAVDSFVNVLQRIRSTRGKEKVMCVVGLTMLDLHMDATDEFVMGCADQKAGIGIFSFARYSATFEERAVRAEFHSSPFSDKAATQAERLKRLTIAAFKTLTHEILHLFGVDHCAWSACLMNGSGRLQEDLTIPMFLCPVDLHKLAFALHENGGVDLVERYRQMADVLRRVVGADDEVRWLETRIARANEDGVAGRTVQVRHASTALSSREARALKRRMLTTPRTKLEETQAELD
jgi:predicted Zn-dependent protease